MVEAVRKQNELVEFMKNCRMMSKRDEKELKKFQKLQKIVKDKRKSIEVLKAKSLID